LKKIKRLYRCAQRSTNSYRKSKRRKEKKEKEMKKAHKEYVNGCACVLGRAKETIEDNVSIDIRSIAIAYEIERYIGHGERQIKQILRRVLNGEKIPHEEKVFSIFEEHTEWISKGKAGVSQELGLNVCVVEDQYKFILHHMVMEKTLDVDIALPITEEVKRLYPDLERMSYDKNFWSPDNKRSLNEIIDEVILPKKGKRTDEEREYENTDQYIYYRRKHAAVESGINALENHGLDRCYDHGINGFKRYVALAIVARNLQNLGNIIQQREVEKMRKLEKLKLQEAA
jgi:IS5 family transposase